MRWQGDAFEKNLVGDFSLWGVFIHPSQVYLGRTYIALVREGDVDPIDGITADETEQLLIIKKGLKTVLYDALAARQAESRCYGQ